MWIFQQSKFCEKNQNINSFWKIRQLQYITNASQFCAASNKHCRQSPCVGGATVYGRGWVWEPPWNGTPCEIRKLGGRDFDNENSFSGPFPGPSGTTTMSCYTERRISHNDCIPLRVGRTNSVPQTATNLSQIANWGLLGVLYCVETLQAFLCRPTRTPE